MYLITPDLAHRIARVGAMTYLEKPLWQIAKRSRPCSAWSFRSHPAASQPDDRWPEKKRSKNFSSPEQKKFQPIPKKFGSIRAFQNFGRKWEAPNFRFFFQRTQIRSFLFFRGSGAFKFGRNILKFGRKLGFVRSSKPFTIVNKKILAQETVLV